MDVIDLNTGVPIVTHVGLRSPTYELLAAAAQRDLPVLDEKLYLEVFAQPTLPTQRRTAAR